MITLSPTDLQFVVRRLPKDLRDLMMTTPLTVAGGFIRETIAGAGQVQDIDVFGPSKEILVAAATVLESARQGSRKFATKNAITLLHPPRLPIQFITRWLFADPKPLIASLDFTVCQAAIWYDRATCTWCSMATPEFYPDLAARRLVYTCPQRDEEVGGSMLRVRKFLARGYNIQAQSLARVIARLASKVRSNDEDHTAFVLAGLLYEVDPLVMVDGLEPVDEHEA